jgi:hypothetical protein
MDPALRRFYNRVRRSVASATTTLTDLLAGVKSPSKNYGSQRMCPFCGLITPRSKRLCLECGKSLKALHVERKDAKQG